MSANPTDEALERLNYFNGQRLVAVDFRSEQSHHVAMRRVLNRSLYSAGIVTGLEVEPDHSDAHRVIVHAGLAFDPLGREIFLPADVSVLVTGMPSRTPGEVFGNLLVVSYREMRRFPVQSGCTVGAPYRACVGALAWGAPTRIVADAVFEVLDSTPAAESGKVVLAQIELSKTCEVVKASPGVRKYAVPVKAGKTRVLSLAGDADVAPNCPKVLHFHIADGLPERALLYLRGGTISSLWYGELARHTHDLDIVVDGNQWVVDFSHSHTFDSASQTDPDTHRHAFWAANDGEDNQGGFKVADNRWDSSNSVKIKASDPDSPLLQDEHFHTLSNVTIGLADRTTDTITPVFSHSSIEETGMEPGVRPGEKAYTYFKELKVKLDDTPVTEKILQQIPTFAQLGVGSAIKPENEPFVADGTPAIDLMLLGVDLLPGAHTLEFVVPNGQGGGKLFYEIYVD
jgi:hypothetical protein